MRNREITVYAATGSIGNGYLPQISCKELQQNKARRNAHKGQKDILLLSGAKVYERKEKDILLPMGFDNNTNLISP